MEAARVEIAEGLSERGSETWRFPRGTRRCVAEEESVDRTFVEELVWNVHGVRREDWIRQPIAAVRSVGAVYSISRVVVRLWSGELQK